MQKVAIETICQAVIKGVEKAQKQYSLWTKGDWLWNAPEYVAITYIAEAIAEEGVFVTPEYCIEDAIIEAGARGRGRLSADLRPNGKMDLLVKWPNKKPRAIIEVKKSDQLSGENFGKDIDRIAGVISKNSEESDFEFGVFVYYFSAKDGVHKEALKRIQDKEDNLLARAEKLKKNMTVSLVESNLHEDNGDYWKAICLKITC